jgi:hypothetical protein
MKLRYANPDVGSINWSILGNGKWLIRKALLRYVKSIHILQSPFDFFTRTIFNNQDGHVTSRMKSALSNFSTSARIAHCRSIPTLLFRCRISLYPDLIYSLCSIDLSVDIGYVCCIPCKYINVPNEELDEILSSLFNESLANI